MISKSVVVVLLAVIACCFVLNSVSANTGCVLEAGEGENGCPNNHKCVLLTKAYTHCVHKDNVASVLNRFKTEEPLAMDNAKTENASEESSDDVSVGQNTFEAAEQSSVSTTHQTLKQQALLNKKPVENEQTGENLEAGEDEAEAEDYDDDEDEAEVMDYDDDDEDEAEVMGYDDEDNYDDEEDEYEF